jgi:hypothetical protein
MHVFVEEWSNSLTATFKWLKLSSEGLEPRTPQLHICFFVCTVHACNLHLAMRVCIRSKHVWHTCSWSKCVYTCAFHMYALAQHTMDSIWCTVYMYTEYGVHSYNLQYMLMWTTYNLCICVQHTAYRVKVGSPCKSLWGGRVLVPSRLQIGVLNNTAC